MRSFDDWFRPRVRTLQIITFALVVGALSASILLVALRGFGPPANRMVISLVAVSFFMIQMALSFVVPGIVITAGLRQIARRAPGDIQDSLFALLQTGRIVRLSLLEGSIFLAAIAFLLEGHLWVLVCPALGLPLMLMPLPTESVILSQFESLGSSLQEMRQE